MAKAATTSKSSGQAPKIESFSAASRGTDATDGSLRIHPGDRVKLEWRISGEVDKLTVEGEVLSAKATSHEMSPSDDVMVTLRAANRYGATEAELFVDVIEPGEVISPHAVSRRKDFESAAPPSGTASAAGAAAQGPEAPISEDTQDTPPAEEQPARGLIWALLVDDEDTGPLAEVSYRIDVGRQRLTGTTDGEGMLVHEDVEPGLYTIWVGEADGTVPALVDPGDEPCEVRVRGARRAA